MYNVLQDFDSLPDQTNNSGKYLTTNGTSASWADINTHEIKISSVHYPSQNDTTVTLANAESIPSDINTYAIAVYRNGIYLNPTIDYGFNVSTRVLTFTEAFGQDEIVTVIFNYLSADTQPEINVNADNYEAGSGITFTDNPITNKVTISADDQLPTQTGNSGKFLTTDGTDVSWATVDALPSQLNNSGKFLTTNGTSASWSSDPFSNWNKDYNDLINTPTTVSSFTNDAGYLTSVNWSDVGDKPTFATVATTGDYSDLTNTPTIPTNVSAFTNDSGYITGVTWDDITNKPASFTPAEHNHDGVYATPSDVSTAVANLVNSAPTTLDTLDELANALGDDPNFATTVATQIGEKLDSDSANYIKSLSISGATITVTKGNDTTSTLTTQDTTYTAGNNITITGTTISADDQLPTQTGNSGKFLTTDGSSVSWGSVFSGDYNDLTNKPTIPTNISAFTNDSGYITGVSWDDVTNKPATFTPATHNHDTEYAPIDIIPSQANNSGKYLTTNGTDVSWATVDALPSQANNSGKFLTTDGTAASWADLADIIKISSLHYPNTNDTTITLTTEQSIPSNVNKYTMSVYRNGIYLNNTIDYGFNSSTRVLTFNKPFGVDEVVTVVFNYFSTDSQTTFDLDIDQFEAGSNITFTDNPVTNKIIISSTDSFSNWDKDYDDLINKPTIPVIPANISAFTNDSGYITGVAWDDVTNKPSTFTPATHNHDAEYAPIDIIPSQTNNSGKYLTTDGTDLSWATVDALPSQANNSGKFLTTNGTAASWADVELLPDQTNNDGKFLSTDGTNTSWEDIFAHEVRLDSAHYPTENSTSIILTTAQVPPTEVLKWGISVYRNGIYLTKSVDYTYNPETRALVFTNSFGSNEIVTVNFAYLSSEGTDASWDDIFSRYVTVTVASNGSHTVTLPSNFISDDSSSLMVFLDGIKQVLNTDYTIDMSTGIITFAEELLAGDTVVVGLYTSSTTHYDAINDLFSTIGNGVLVGDGNTLDYKNFTKTLYTQDTAADNETITVPTEIDY